MIRISCVLVIFIFLICNGVSAQDIAKMVKEKPLKITGTIGAGLNFYNSNAQYGAQDPFSWQMNGSINAKVYGFDIPLSFSITQFNNNYSVPFSQFGIAPKYKWLKLYAGYNSMNMSPLIFSGQTFLGGGIELTPGKFRFSFFSGTLNKSIQPDTILTHNVQPQYLRTAYGLKLGYGSERRFFDIILFHAKDDSSSISVKTFNRSVRPMENVVGGTSFKFVLFKDKIIFTGDLAASLNTNDQASKAIDSIISPGLSKLFNNFLNLRYSSVFGISGQGSMMLMLKNFTTSINYKRIDPDFKSLGTPFIGSDMEAYTINATTSFFKHTVNVNGLYSSTTNNLNHNLLSTTMSHNTVININSRLSRRLNLNTVFSDINLYQGDGTAKVKDSVRLNQDYYTISISPSFNFPGKATMQTIGFNCNYMKSDDRNPGTRNFSAMENLSTNLNYTFIIPKKKLNLFTNCTYNHAQNNVSLNETVGLGGGCSKQYTIGTASLNAQANINGFMNYANGKSLGNTFSSGINIGYSLQKHQSLSFFMNYQSSAFNNNNQISSTSTTMGGINYSYNF
ncbi:MAG: hypothetical protein WCP65_04540 [Bacteroidota bacterium]